MSDILRDCSERLQGGHLKHYLNYHLSLSNAEFSPKFIFLHVLVVLSCFMWKPREPKCRLGVSWICLVKKSSIISVNSACNDTWLAVQGYRPAFQEF